MKEKSKTNTEKIKKGKCSARVICQDQSEFWTTQSQFWQWIREHKVVKLHDSPLTGMFTNQDEASLIVISNNIFNKKHRNHIAEALASRRLMKNRRN
jgi:hypothetical protein